VHFLAQYTVGIMGKLFTKAEETMRRDIELMASLIREGKLFFEEESKRPLLPEDLQFSLSYRPATPSDIKYFVESPAWTGMLSSGRAFFAR